MPLGRVFAWNGPLDLDGRPAPCQSATTGAPGAPDAAELLASDIERLTEQLAEARGAMRDAIAAPNLDRAREILRRKLQ